MDMEKQESHQKEAREMEIEKLEKQWNKTLLEVLKTKYAEADKKLPDLPKDELVVKAPYLLEEVTEDRLEEKKGKNQFLIISGPSGVGRTSIGKELKERGISGISHVTSKTPRSKEEINSGDYIYVTQEEFDHLRKEGQFLQYAQTYGDWRAIRRKEFNDLINSGQKFYIDKSIRTTKRLLKKSEVSRTPHLRLFILPPSFKELVRRITERTSQEAHNRESKITETLTTEQIENRLGKGVEALDESLTIYDAYIVNDDISRVVQKITKYL